MKRAWPARTLLLRPRRLVEEELHGAIATAGHHLLGVRGRVTAAGGEEATLPGRSTAWQVERPSGLPEPPPTQTLRRSTVFSTWTQGSCWSMPTGSAFLRHGRRPYGAEVHVPHPHGTVQGGGEKEVCPCCGARIEAHEAAGCRFRLPYEQWS